MTAQKPSLDEIFGFAPQQKPSLDQIFAQSGLPQEKGFFGRVGEDLSKRYQKAVDISKGMESGTYPRGVGNFVQATQIPGAIGDFIGEGIVSAVKTTNEQFPETTKAAVDFVKPVANTMVGRGLSDAVKYGVNEWNQFKEKHPVRADVIAGTGNLLTSIYPVAKGGKRVASQIKNVENAISYAKPSIMDAEALRATGSQLFNEADQIGGVLKNTSTSKFFNDAKAVLPQTKAGAATAGENELTKLLKRWDDAGITNSNLDFNSLKEMDEALGDMAFSNVDNFGRLNKEGQKLYDLQTKLRNNIESASPADFIGGSQAFDKVKEARDYWSASLRLRDVERIIERGLNAEQPGTSIKNGFNTLLNSKRFAQFNDAEKAAIRQAAKKGSLAGFLGTMGSRLMQVMGAGIGGAQGGPLGAAQGAAAGYAVSAGARGAATAAQLKKARKVEELIRMRVSKGAPNQVKITPEIAKLLGEIGITQMPAGGVSALMDQLQQIKESGDQ